MQNGRRQFSDKLLGQERKLAIDFAGDFEFISAHTRFRILQRPMDRFWSTGT
jgi:hypothetical protein